QVVRSHLGERALEGTPDRSADGVDDHGFRHVFGPLSRYVASGGVDRGALQRAPLPERIRGRVFPGAPAALKSAPRTRGDPVSDEPVKYVLPESEIPTHWVNLMPDLPGDPSPPLNPGTGEPAGPDDLTPIFPMGLIEQEVATDPEVEIPDEVRDVYKRWRPSPLFRARRLERALDTPAHIYYKYEGGSPAGSHKPNSAVPQAYENKKAGVRRLATETGAGQWGSALALACSLFDLDCVVCMHQTVIGQEAMRQMEMAGEEPDIVIGCVGGGSNFAGLSFPFVRRRLRGESEARFLAAEPAACPTLTRGVYRYDFGDTSGTT